MKTVYKHILLGGFLLAGTVAPLAAQDSGCVSCNATTVSGNYASAIGNGTKATGNHAFSGGYLSQASGSNSFAFGYNSKATQSTTAAIGNNAQAIGTGSFAFGTYVKASAKNALAIGTGTTQSYPLTNSTANSIALGVNSNKPTVLITQAQGNNFTGKVAIGSITSPQAKLHLKSDTNEDAGVFLEPSDKNNKKAFLKLFDNEHMLSVDKSGTLSVLAGTGRINFSGTSCCFSTESEDATYSIDFSNDNLRFRTAQSMLPRGSTAYNWKDLLILGSNGKIGIGSSSTYLQNTKDQQLTIHSPSRMDLQSSSLVLNGKVGINTVNDVNEYALAVNGGIISTKVFIKEVNLWPDYVFHDAYPLMPLDALKSYLQENRHLPGVPSESTVIQNGYDLHEMNCVLLEKIEEMTRYLLMLQEEIDTLKSQKSSKTKTVEFAYDENGNRISRSLLFKRLTDPEGGKDQPSRPTTQYDLFPNPTEGQFSLVMKGAGSEQRLHATLVTSNGIILDERDLTESRTDFDLSRQANGLYFLEINGTSERQVWKIIKRE